MLQFHWGPHLTRRSVTHLWKYRLLTRAAYGTTLLNPTAAPRPTFHDMISDGWGGMMTFPFPMVFRDLDQTEPILESLTRFANSHSPTTTIYNYRLIHLLQRALLMDPNTNRPPLLSVTGAEIYKLISDMEVKHRLQPDIITFEWLLWFLSQHNGFSMATEEIFQLMTIRYGLKPSGLCWAGRIASWLWQYTERRAIFLLEEFKSREGGRLAAFPQLYYQTAIIAFSRGRFAYLRYVLSCITPLVEASSSSPTESHRDWEVLLPGVRRTQPPVIFTSRDYLNLLTNRKIITHLRNNYVVKVVRFLLRQLAASATPIQGSDSNFYNLAILPTESTLAQILYSCSRVGNSVADIAYTIFRQLLRLYKEEGEEKIKLPRSYLEAFVECIKRDTLIYHPAGQLFYESGLEVWHRELADKIQALLPGQEDRLE